MGKNLVVWSHLLLVVSGSESQWPSGTSGVPQGSVQHLLFQDNNTGIENTFGQEGTELLMVAVFSAEGMLWGAGAGIG